MTTATLHDPHAPFLATIAARPDDEFPKLLWADFCGENGELDLERALRYCVREGKWPNCWGPHGDRRHRWSWYNEAEILMSHNRDFSDELPESFFDRPIDFAARFETLPAALRWLGERIAERGE